MKWKLNVWAGFAQVQDFPNPEKYSEYSSCQDPDKDGAFGVGTLHINPTHGTKMTAGSPEDLPLIDSVVLQDMKTQVGDAVARTFIQDFTQVWDQRYERVAAAVEASDRASALDVVLSIKITSLMLGAVSLAEFAFELEGLIRQSDMDATMAMMPHLRQCGNQTVDVLLSEHL